MSSKNNEIKWTFRANESDKKVHILFNPDKRFLGHPDLPNGKDVILTIKSMGMAMVRNPVTKLEVEKKIVEFVENQSWVKPFICNKTNADMIFKITGCRFMDEVAGKKIRIGADKARLGKDEVDCLRIRNVKSCDLEKDAKPISIEQVNEIKTLLSMQNEKTESGILSAFKISDLTQIPPSRFEGIKKTLVQIVEQNSQNNQNTNVKNELIY